MNELDEIKNIIIETTVCKALETYGSPEAVLKAFDEYYAPFGANDGGFDESYFASEEEFLKYVKAYNKFNECFGISYVEFKRAIDEPNNEVIAKYLDTLMKQGFLDKICDGRGFVPNDERKRALIIHPIFGKYFINRSEWQMLLEMFA